MIRYPKWWMRCLKRFERSLEGKQRLGQPKSPGLYSGTKGTPAQIGLEDKNEFEGEMVQGNFEETWGRVPLTLKETLLSFSGVLVVTPDFPYLVKTFRIPLDLSSPFPEVLRLPMDRLLFSVPLGLNKVVSFEVVCRDMNIVPTVALFRVFQCLCKQGDWFSYSKRQNMEDICMDDGPSSLKKWKSKKVFFLIDRRLFVDHLHWRHYHSFVYDDLPTDGYDRNDVEWLRVHLIRLREIREEVLVRSEMNIYDFMTLPSWGDAKIVEKPHHLFEPLLERVSSHTAAHVAEDALIPLPTLEELSQPSKKRRLKKRASEAGSSAPELGQAEGMNEADITDFCTELKDSMERDECTSIRATSVPTPRLGKRLGPPPSMAVVSVFGPAHVGTSAHASTSGRSLAFGGSVAGGFAEKSRAEDVWRQMDPLDALAHSVLSRDTEYDEIPKDDFGTTTRGEEIELTLFPFALGPYHMSYPYEGVSSHLYTKEEWDGSHAPESNILCKDIFKDLDVCRKALDRTINPVELRRTESLLLLELSNRVNVLSALLVSHGTELNYRYTDLVASRVRLQQKVDRKTGYVKVLRSEVTSLDDKHEKVQRVASVGLTKELSRTDANLSEQVLTVRDLPNELALERLLSSDEFHAALAHVVSIGINYGVERGLRMGRTNADFEAAAKKVSNFHIGAEADCNKAFVAFPTTPFPFLDKVAAAAGGALSKVTQILPDKLVCSATLAPIAPPIFNEASDQVMRSGVTTRIPEKLLGDEGLCSRGTKLNSIFITVEKFLEEFLQQKRYAKDPIEIHGIKRRQNEGLQDFMDRFKSESSHIKGVPLVLRISAFMHGHSHPELAKKLNEKIPKWMKCSKGSEPSIGEKWPLDQQKWSILLKDTKFTFVRHGQEDLKEPKTGAPKGSTKEYGGVYSLSQKRFFHPAYQDSEINPRHGKLEEANRRSRGLGKIGSSSEGHLPKQPAEWEPGKERCEGQKHDKDGRKPQETFLRRKVRHDEQTHLPSKPPESINGRTVILEGIIEGNQIQRILVDGGSSSEIMYEHCFKNLDVNIRSKLRRCKATMTVFLGETYHPLGVIDLQVTMGREGRSKTVLMEFAIVKCRSPYNIIIGRTRMRSLGAVGSTIHSMIKFPTNQGVVTMETSREALRECKHLEMVLCQGHVSLSGGRRRASIFNGISVQMFPQLPKEYSQIRMAEEDEEKTGFHMEEGVYYFTHMPKELKNFAATLQRMMEKHPLREARTRMEIAKGYGWTNEAEEAFRRIKRKSGKLPTLAIPKEGEDLMLCKEALEEGSGIRICLVSLEEKMYSYVIRLKFKASNYAIDCEALLAGLAASANQGNKTCMSL
ncbi:reverse transcriptase domain-containing protein [Tanacetum coccineum]